MLQNALCCCLIVENQSNIRVGNTNIKVRRKDVHVGVTLSSQSERIMEMIEERIQKCKSICNATQGIGSHLVPVTAVTSEKVY